MILSVNSMSNGERSFYLKQILQENLLYIVCEIAFHIIEDIIDTTQQTKIEGKLKLVLGL